MTTTFKMMQLNLTNPTPNSANFEFLLADEPVYNFLLNIGVNETQKLVLSSNDMQLVCEIDEFKKFIDNVKNITKETSFNYSFLQTIIIGFGSCVNETIFTLSLNGEIFKHIINEDECEQIIIEFEKFYNYLLDSREEML